MAGGRVGPVKGEPFLAQKGRGGRGVGRIFSPYGLIFLTKRRGKPLGPSPTCRSATDL